MCTHHYTVRVNKLVLLEGIILFEILAHLLLAVYVCLWWQQVNFKWIMNAVTLTNLGLSKRSWLGKSFLSSFHTRTIERKKLNAHERRLVAQIISHSRWECAISCAEKTIVPTAMRKKSCFWSKEKIGTKISRVEYEKHVHTSWMPNKCFQSLNWL